jgi:hypothetical protein
VRLWEDYKARPLEKVLQGDCRDQYDRTFRYLVGEHIDWSLERGNGQCD